MNTFERSTKRYRCQLTILSCLFIFSSFAALFLPLQTLALSLSLFLSHRLINTSTVLIGWYEFLHEFLFHDIQLNFVIKRILSLRRRFIRPGSFLLLTRHTNFYTTTCFISFLLVSFPISISLLSSSYVLCVFISILHIVLYAWSA